MGVINLTPDSFSDGGKFSSAQDVENEIISLQNQGHFCFDFGAESTAPKNAPISIELEQSRLKEFLFPLLQKKILNAQNILSLDTYHYETMEMVIDKYPHYRWIWNDVSGKWDQSVNKFLNRYPNTYYIYSHNPAPTRQESGLHQKYVPNFSGSEYFSQIKKYFIEAKKQDCTRVIFDPCFGFGKNTEQNWYLWDHLPELVSEINHDKWLIGISRKRFLREKNIDEAAQLDLIEAKKLQLTAEKNVLWRVHAAQNYKYL